MIIIISQTVTLKRRIKKSEKQFIPIMDEAFSVIDGI